MPNSQQQAEKILLKREQKKCPRLNKLRTICQLTLSVWAHGRGQIGTPHTSTCRHTTIWRKWNALCTRTHTHIYSKHTRHIKTLIEAGNCCLILQLLKAAARSSIFPLQAREFLLNIQWLRVKLDATPEQMHLLTYALYAGQRLPVLYTATSISLYDQRENKPALSHISNFESNATHVK